MRSKCSKSLLLNQPEIFLLVMRLQVNYCSIVDVEQEPENEKVKMREGGVIAR